MVSDESTEAPDSGRTPGRGHLGASDRGACGRRRAGTAARSLQDPMADALQEPPADDLQEPEERSPAARPKRPARRHRSRPGTLRRMTLSSACPPPRPSGKYWPAVMAVLVVVYALLHLRAAGNLQDAADLVLPAGDPDPCRARHHRVRPGHADRSGGDRLLRRLRAGRALPVAEHSRAKSGAACVPTWIPLWMLFGVSIVWFLLFKPACCPSAPPDWLGWLSMAALGVWCVLAVRQVKHAADGEGIGLPHRQDLGHGVLAVRRIEHFLGRLRAARRPAAGRAMGAVART